MSRLTKILSCLVFQALAAVAGLAQAEGVRKATFARVVDVAGQPVAGARVTFAGGMPHLGAEVSPVDLQVVASDARGRAQAKLQPGLCYVAWAIGQADTAGGSKVGSPVGYFGAGAILELRCDMVSRPRVLECRGTEPWRALGPLRFFVVTAFPGDEQELVLDANGALAVPPGPFQQIEVRSKDGQPLWSTSSACEMLQLPPPQRVAVSVQDENGAPLAGVVMRHRVARRIPWRIDGFGGTSDGRFRDLGITPASGKLELVVPYATNPLATQSAEDLLLFACAPQRPAVAGGVFGKSVYENDKRCVSFEGSELVFRCPKVDPLCGHCGPVPAGTVAHLAAVCKLVSESASYSHDPRSFTAPVGPDGSFAFLDVPDQLHSCRLTLIPPPSSSRVLPLFPAQSGRELPIEVALLPGRPSSALAPIDIADVRLRVVDADGMPAQGVVAFLAPGDQRGVLLRDSLVRMPLDTGGVGNLALLPGTWVLLVVSRQGYAATKLELTAGEREETLSLQPLAQMRLSLRDAGGKPVAGAQLQARGSSTRSSGDPVQSLLQSYSTNQRSQWSSLRTDAGGLLTLSFVPVEGITNRAGLFWADGSTEDFPVEPNGAALQLKAR